MVDSAAIKAQPLEWLVWCESLERANCHIVKTDIEKAITWYRDQTGYYPAAICLSKKIAELMIKYGNVPEGISIFEKGGCLSWEIWLGGKSEKLFPPVAGDSPETNSSSVAKTRKQPGVGKTTSTGIMLHQNKRNQAVKSKISDSGNYVTKKHRGRPLKKGEVTRMTKYRRKKKEEQLNLFGTD